MRLRSLLLCSFLATSWLALGAPVDVRVVVRGGTDTTPLPNLQIEIVGEETEKLLPVSSREVQFDLEQPGVWYLRAVADGHWGESRSVILPYSGERVDLPLWPAATLRGRVQQPITQIAVRFQSASTENAGPSGFEDCTIAKEIVQCTIPSGLVDYSLRAPGFVPIHRWSQAHAPGETVDLGRLAFERGSSLLGRVTMPKDWRPEKGARIRVELAPEITPSHRPGETSRSRLGATSVVPNERGFFLFEGVPPGAYEISAAGGGLVSERRAVTVLDGLQAELRTPLALSQPLTMSLTVDPPVDPWGAPWMVELSRLEIKSTADVHLVDTAKVAETGTWSRAGLTPGDYFVKIRRVRGVWHSQLVHLAGGDDAVAIRIPLAKVAGELKLGDAPLAGTVWFGGELGEISIPIRTSPDGHFKAYLPIVEGDVWKEVDVASDAPFVRTTITRVRLQGPDADGISTVTLVLPDNRLFGEVVTEDGKPASSNATVFASMRDADFPPLQAEVDDAGIFSFTGLKPGSYSVYAVGADGESTAKDVELGDATAAELKILLHREKLLTGTVRSRHGAVAGARVSAFPEDRTGFGIVQWDQTDFEGRFAVAVPSGAQNVTLTVGAPGYAYTLVPVPAIPGEPLSIFVEQDGGRIVADLQPYEKPRQPYLFHGRAFVSFASLEQARVAVKDGDAQAIGELAPGQYDVCIATPEEAMLLASAAARSRARCLTGFVARGSVLALREPDGR
jgi:hypothetical protein